MPSSIGHQGLSAGKACRRAAVADPSCKPCILELVFHGESVDISCVDLSKGNSCATDFGGNPVHVPSFTIHDMRRLCACSLLAIRMKRVEHKRRDVDEPEQTPGGQAGMTSGCWRAATQEAHASQSIYKLVPTSEQDTRACNRVAQD